jgi:hypothetical protein
MQKKKKRMFGNKSAVIDELRVNLDEGAATLSSMMQSYKVRIKGVSHDNMDGTNRQTILTRCKIGDEVKLTREPENLNDKVAIAVYWRSEKLGYVPAGDERLAIHMDAGFEVFAHIVAIDGGPSTMDRCAGGGILRTMDV